MKLIAYMINVSYYKSIDSDVLPEILMKKYSGGFSNIKNISLLPKEDYEQGTILGEEPKENWSIETHYMGKGIKSKKAIYQIAFEPVLEKDESLDDFYLRLRASKDSNNIDYLRYCSKSNLFFYSEPKQRKKKKYCSLANTAGKFIVEVVKLENNTVLKSIDVIVKPSSLTYDDYLKMIRDLREIREDIVINNNSKISVGQRYIDKNNNIEETIKELQSAINGINNKPKSKLEVQYVKKKYNQINKITNKTLLEKSIYPYKNTFTSIDYKESFDLYENRILKQVLINLKEKIKEYEEFYEDYIRGEERENSKVRKRFKEITSLSIEEKIQDLKKKLIERNDLLEKIMKEDIKITYSNTDLIIFKNNDFKKYKLGINYDENIKKFVLKFKSSIYKESDNKYFTDIRAGQCNSTISNINTYNSSLDISLISNNINEMIFLVNSLEEKKIMYGKATRILIKFNAEKISKYNGTVYLRINSIQSIDGVPVKVYSIDEKHKFFERYFDDKNDEENFNMLNSIIKKEEEISNLKKKFNDDDSWSILKEKVDNMLSLDIFKDVKPKEINLLRPTQIFINDNYYRKAYKVIKKYNDKVSIVDMKSPDTILVKSTCDIYEIWCLFKIVQLLIINQKWTLLNSKTVLKDIDNFLNSKNPYEEKEVKFRFNKVLKDGYSIDLTLIYEGRIYYKNNKYKTPDYQFIYEVKNESNEVVNTMRAYLDAKYRNYNNQGDKAYTDDIENVAINKYIKTFEDTINKATCSMIVHSYNNEKYVNWGSDNEEREILIKETGSELKAHGYGAFYLVPSDLSNLNKFLRLLPEYHLKFNSNLGDDENNSLEGYHMCWQCGEVENIDIKIKYTKGGNLKYHYTCNNCNEFWVKNHCLDEKEHKLIKHRDNYHLLKKDTSNPWHLICPICGNDGIKKGCSNVINELQLPVLDIDSFNNNQEIAIEERIPF